MELWQCPTVMSSHWYLVLSIHLTACYSLLRFGSRMCLKPTAHQCDSIAIWYDATDFGHSICISAVVDKRFVDKIGNKTAILRKYNMSTKILFCRHNNVLFWKRKGTLKKLNIDKLSLQKARLFAKSALLSKCSGTFDAQPATIYPASLDDPLRKAKFRFWSEHRCIYFLNILKFDPTCRQRNPCSTTALICILYSLTPFRIIVYEWKWNRKGFNVKFYANELWE